MMESRGVLLPCSELLVAELCDVIRFGIVTCNERCRFSTAGKRYLLLHFPLPLQGSHGTIVSLPVASFELPIPTSPIPPYLRRITRSPVKGYWRASLIKCLSFSCSFSHSLIYLLRPLIYLLRPLTYLLA